MKASNFIISLIANVYLIALAVWCTVFAGSSIAVILTDLDFRFGIVFPTVLCILGAMTSLIWLFYCNPFKEKGSLMISDKLFFVIFVSMFIVIKGVQNYV